MNELPYQRPPKVNHKPFQPHRPNLVLDSIDNRRVKIDGRLFGQNTRFFDSQDQQRH